MSIFGEAVERGEEGDAASEGAACSMGPTDASEGETPKGGDGAFRTYGTPGLTSSWPRRDLSHVAPGEPEGEAAAQESGGEAEDAGAAGAEDGAPDVPEHEDLPPLEVPSTPSAGTAPVFTTLDVPAREPEAPPEPEFKIARGEAERPSPAFNPDAVAFTDTAADCVDKARQIAKLLNNTHVRAAHLILAMTLDEAIARKMQKDLDVDRARRMMLRKLGDTDWRYNGEPGMGPELGRDLADVFAAAAAEAGERNQDVSLYDLFRGFERVSGDTPLFQDEEKAIDPASIAAQLETRLQPLLAQTLAASESRVAQAVEAQLMRALPVLAQAIASQLEQAELARQESARQEALRQEALRQEALRQEAQREEAARQENAPIEAPARSYDEEPTEDEPSEGDASPFRRTITSIFGERPGWPQ